MEPTNNTTNKILSAIETKQVTPRPKWFFVLRNWVMWIPGVITTILGAYTIAGLLYGFIHAHITPVGVREYGNPAFLMAIVPLLWVLSFMIFSIISTTLLRKTHTGYRHTTLQLLLVSVASSIIIGILFYALTQDIHDNKVRTLYRYPTQHRDEYFFKLFPPPPERNIPLLRIN